MPDYQEGHAINEAHKTPTHNKSRFNLSVKRALTPRFGVNTLFYAKEVLPEDGPITIEPNSNTRSYTLKAPLMGDINKHVSFYQVPLQAILPFNWEKIVKQSDRGTDVQNVESGTGIVSALNGVNCVVSNFPYRLSQRLASDWLVLQTAVDETTRQETLSVSDYIKNILHFVIRWEMFFSQGSLLSYCGIHYGNSIEFINRDTNEVLTFDSMCQKLLASIEPYHFSLIDDGATGSVSKSSGASHVRRCLEFMRQHTGPFIIQNLEETIFDTEVTWYDISDFDYISYINSNSEPLNYGRLVAYQLVNAHYLTNSKVDYIYNADLYRQYISSVIRSGYGPTVSNGRFSYNGIDCPYDWLSGYFFNLELSSFVDSFNYISSDLWSSVLPYFNAIFGWNYSLRFMDYFVGARPRNYAIGNTSVAVANNSVSVIDTTKGIVKQRYLNAVARVGQTIEDYAKELFGTNMAPDWHDPKYLFSYDEQIYGSEIENTGAGQLSDASSVTSVLRGNSGNHQFTFSIDRHSFIVGIETFDIRRFYFTTQPKTTTAIDRFDMFVPQLQYIGDQPLNLSELLAGSAKDTPFGYQLRDMQYKQEFDDCAGGFVENLPGWLFKFDPAGMTTRARNELTISPEFIRSQPCELDEFYLALTGLTLASYFHFIEVWDIKVSAERPMAYAPEIL